MDLLHWDSMIRGLHVYKKNFAPFKIIQPSTKNNKIAVKSDVKDGRI